MLAGRSWAALLFLAVFSACCGLPAAQQALKAPALEKPEPKICWDYFEGIKPSLDQCKQGLSAVLGTKGSTCPRECKDNFKNMPNECSAYVAQTLPDALKAKTSNQTEQPFDICDMLYCSSETCSITLDVVHTLDLFSLPEAMDTSGGSSSVNVAAIVAGVVVGNAVIVVLVGGFVWFHQKRHDSRVRPSEHKDLAMASPRAPGAVLSDSSTQGAVSLDAMERGGAVGGKHVHSRSLALPAVAVPGGPASAARVSLTASVACFSSRHSHEGRAASAGTERAVTPPPPVDVDSMQAVAQLWAQAAAQGRAAGWLPPYPSLPPSSSRAATSHMQHDDLQMMWLDSTMSASQPAQSTQSDSLLSWVSRQLMQQHGSQGGQKLSSPAARSSGARSSPAAGSTEVLAAPAAGSRAVQHESSSDVQLVPGSGAALARMAAMGSRRRSSRWTVMDSHRSSGLADLKPWQLNFSDLRMQRPLGKGSFGKVFLATWNETLVAVKVLLSTDDAATAARSGSSSGSSLGFPLTALEDLQKEAGLMASLRHPNVVLFLGFCISPPALVTEYCSRGSLLDVLRAAQSSEQGRQQLTWVRRLSMALDAAKGMLCLHAHIPPILHRDLKSPNLLVDAAWRVKVCDFNLSKLLEDTVRSSSADGMLNPRWLAPEVLMGQPASAASDVFSFGTVLWELATWQLPWEGSNPYQLVFVVSRGERLPIPLPDQLPGPEQLGEYDAYASLIQRCWAQEPSDRPTFADTITELRAIITQTVAANAATSAPPTPTAAQES